VLAARAHARWLRRIRTVRTDGRPARTAGARAGAYGQAASHLRIRGRAVPFPVRCERASIRIRKGSRGEAEPGESANPRPQRRTCQGCAARPSNRATQLIGAHRRVKAGPIRGLFLAVTHDLHLSRLKNPTPLTGWERSMRCEIRVLLLAMLGASAALAQTQNIPPPPPVVLLPQTSIANACTLGCDSSAMFCLNTCVQPATATSPANQQCSLSCTTSQLVCKQRC
jgi:hypothetical protein